MLLGFRDLGCLEVCRILKWDKLDHFQGTWDGSLQETQEGGDVLKACLLRLRSSNLKGLSLHGAPKVASTSAQSTLCTGTTFKAKEEGLLLRTWVPYLKSLGSFVSGCRSILGI